MKANPWRWLKRLLFLSVFALVALLAFAYWALPPLAEVAIKQAIESGAFTSQKFRVGSIGLRETLLEDVDFAGEGWRIQAPTVSAVYGWAEVQASHLRAITIPQATLTIDLGKLSEADEETRPTEGPAFPFDELELTEITLILKRGDVQRELTGHASISEGLSLDGPKWESLLKGEQSELLVQGGLGTDRQLRGITAQGAVTEIEEWLALADVEWSQESLSSGEVNLDLQWKDGASWSMNAQTEELRFDDGSTLMALTKVRAMVSHDAAKGWQANGFGAIERGQWQTWMLQEGEAQWSWHGEGHQVEIAQSKLTHDKVFRADVGGSFHFNAKSWQGTLAFAEPLVSGQAFETIEAKVEGEGGTFTVQVPRLALVEWPMASVRQLVGKISPGKLSFEGAHYIDYGMGEVYGPVPVTLTGQEDGETWGLALEAVTKEGSSWQAYWKELGFSLIGNLVVNWQFPKEPIMFRSALESLDVRLNESAVTLEEVALDGTYAPDDGALVLKWKGKSMGQPFQGGVTSRQEKEGQAIDYRIEKLRLPENTLLGAFSEPFKQMPMAAFLDANGEIRQHKEEKTTHGLTLKLARGLYRHPERKLAGRGIGGTFAIESFDPFVTVDDQRAVFSEWKMGDLTLNEGKFLYKLGPEGAVQVKAVQARALDGVLSLESLSYHPGHPDFESVVTFDKIELSQLTKLYPNFEGRVGGRVSGQVHLRFKDGILSLPQGSLQLDSGSAAYLRLDAKKALGTQLSDLADDPDALQIVELALKDLVVDELDIGFFDPEADESVCRIRLRGRSREEVPIPKTNGGKAIAPIHLNINVDDPSELVRRLLNFSLRKQLETKLNQ